MARTSPKPLQIGYHHMARNAPIEHTLPKPPKWPPNCELTPEALKHLGALHQLLLALNDALVSRSKLQMLTASIPVLAARVVHQAKARWPSIDSLSEALQRIGNRGLEKNLLEFLEDLTVYKADHEAQEDVAVAGTAAATGTAATATAATATEATGTAATPAALAGPPTPSTPRKVSRAPRS